MSKLPDIIDFCRTYMGVDPVTQPMPVQPTAHYGMGGIPTSMYGEVVIDEENTVMPGLYAAGETACVSVHGANRLGTNSLLDIVVFGKHSGLRAAEHARQSSYQPLPKDPDGYVREQLDALRNADGSELAADLRREMQDIMFADVGVFRTEEGMSAALEKVKELKRRYRNVRARDPSRIFNTEILEAWELGCLLDLAQVTARAALERKESRGAHAREDYPERDDKKWLKHSLAYLDEKGVSLKYKPVTMTRFEPKKRVY
jgi:succinate dehydrogenase / fumarate reductase flavoprotein subunit